MVLLIINPANLIIAFLLTNFLNSPLTVYAIVFPMCFAMSESFGVSPSKTMYPLCVVSIVCCCALPLSAAITDAGMFNGYLEGYRPLDKRFGFITNMVFRHLDKSKMCQVIEIDFAKKG